MKICGNCGATFEDDDLVEGKCPECNSADVDNAIKCGRCDDTIPEDCARDLNGLKVCEECYFAVK